MRFILPKGTPSDFEGKDAVKAAAIALPARFLLMALTLTLLHCIRKCPEFFGPGFETYFPALNSWFAGSLRISPEGCKRLAYLVGLLEFFYYGLVTSCLIICWMELNRKIAKLAIVLGVTFTVWVVREGMLHNSSMPPLLCFVIGFGAISAIIVYWLIERRMRNAFLAGVSMERQMRFQAQTSSPPPNLLEQYRGLEGFSEDE